MFCLHQAKKKNYQKVLGLGYYQIFSLYSLVEPVPRLHQEITGVQIHMMITCADSQEPG